MADIAHEHKAEDISVLDMRKVVNFCDYFVICSGTSDRHARAIADYVEEGLKDIGMKVQFKEGLRESNWIVFDVGDVVLHVFQKQVREFYQLEYLWQEAKPVKLSFT